MSEINYTELADEYRCLWKLSGGAVIFYKGVAQGWLREIRDPQDWLPGCIAVDALGAQWIATGGTQADGASVWEQKRNEI